MEADWDFSKDISHNERRTTLEEGVCTGRKGEESDAAGSLGYV